MSAIPVHHPCPCDHNDQRDEKRNTGDFLKDHKGQHSPDERRYGIICACFCRSGITLRIDMETNAQAIGNKAKEHHFQNISQCRKTITVQQTDPRKKSRARYPVIWYNVYRREEERNED